MTQNDLEASAAQNTDHELWRKVPGDFYSPSIHVTENGGIGINVSGSVYVKPIEEWHRLAGGKLPGIRAQHDLEARAREKAREVALRYLEDFDISSAQQRFDGLTRRIMDVLLSFAQEREAELAQARADLEKAYQYIVARHDARLKDYACRECVPDNDFLQEFQCGFHRAKQALAGLLSFAQEREVELEKLCGWLADANKKWCLLDIEHEKLKAELAQARAEIERLNCKHDFGLIVDQDCLDTLKALEARNDHEKVSLYCNLCRAAPNLAVQWVTTKGDAESDLRSRLEALQKENDQLWAIIK